MFSQSIEEQLTKQDYTPKQIIEGVKFVELKELVDDGGSFLELGRLDAGKPQAIPGIEVRQINYSRVLPGAIKATHIHKSQDDIWFVPAHDRLLVGLKDIREGSASEGVSMRFVLGAGKSRLLYIPPGVAHGVANPYDREMTLIYFVTQQFSADPATTEEYRLPPDYFGEKFWEIQRG